MHSLAVDCIFDGNNRWPFIMCCSGRWLNTTDSVNRERSDGTKMELWRKGNVTHSVNRPWFGARQTNIGDSSGIPRRKVWGWGSNPLPRKFRRPSKIVPNSTRLLKLLKIVEFRTPTPQDVREKGSKILKLPSVRNCFTLAMTNKLVIINSHKVHKVKKILLYEIKFLVPNYSCLQNPWVGDYRPQIPVLSVLNWICCPPPPTKFLGTPLGDSSPICLQYNRKYNTLRPNTTSYVLLLVHSRHQAGRENKMIRHLKPPLQV